MRKIRSFTHNREIQKSVEINQGVSPVEVIRARTGYHLVDASPWPIVARFSALTLVRGLLR